MPRELLSSSETECLESAIKCNDNAQWRKNGPAREAFECDSIHLTEHRHKIAQNRLFMCAIVVEHVRMEKARMNSTMMHKHDPCVVWFVHDVLWCFYIMKQKVIVFVFYRQTFHRINGLVCECAVIVNQSRNSIANAACRNDAMKIWQGIYLSFAEFIQTPIYLFFGQENHVWQK